jgi:hypothetical protein
MPSRRRSPTRSRRAKKSTKSFDATAFLSNSGIGRTVRAYAPNQTIFSQGEPADTVFYIIEQTGLLWPPTLCVQRRCPVGTIRNIAFTSSKA